MSCKDDDSYLLPLHNLIFFSLGALLYSSGRCSVCGMLHGVCVYALLACALCWVPSWAPVAQRVGESGNFRLPTMHPGHALLWLCAPGVWLPSTASLLPFQCCALPLTSCASQLLHGFVFLQICLLFLAGTLAWPLTLRLLPLWVLPVGAALPQRHLPH